MKARVRAIRPSILVALAAALVACSAPADEAPPEGGAAATDPFVPPELPGADIRPEGAVDPWAFGPRFGARVLASGDLEVRTRSARATRVELCLFRKSFGEPERLRLPMTRDASGVFSLVVKAGELTEKGITGAIFYGFRAFGPNWPYDPSFAPGSRAGFLSDVDDAGNRNPYPLMRVQATAKGADPKVAGKLFQFVNQPAATPASAHFAADLSPREREILELIAEGLSNAEIADRLFLSKGTVQNYVSTLFAKLDVTSRGRLIVWARDAGLGRGAD